MSYKKRILLAVCASELCLALCVWATTITVTNTNDSGPGSLRQALADVNDGDTITFAVTGTIALTSGELTVDDNVTISGPGPDLLGVSASALQGDRVFHVMEGHVVTLEGLTISGGSDGGIYNYQSTLSVHNCIVRDNQGDQGAGIYSDPGQGSATLTVFNSMITNNCACRDYGSGSGGGIAGGGEVTIVNTTVSNNFAVSFPDLIGDGGGISSGGILTITASTISGNIAVSYGGGIITGNAVITDSTISGNLAGGQFGFTVDLALAAVSPPVDRS